MNYDELHIVCYGGIVIGTYSAIADAGASLLKLLRENMTPEPVAQSELIGMASPADKGDLVLSLYLYRITENSEARRNEMQARGSGMLQFPPMAVDLHYILTPYSSADLHSRTLDEHVIIGRAMQVLHDHAIVRGGYLQGSLAESNEELRVVVESLPVDILTGLWNFGDMPYKMSLPIRVGPVNVDSTRLKSTTRVVERHIKLEEKG
ncbi:DUF4255 domain-containing protein [Paenibacillus sp. BC26]|uniref:DUF4255 domain-containing protein n=1 Tax=Paenibacillus sp. BC26 TaxID=1881032 RepID=UPI00210A2B13|nr:DUF4255 domain-containing protein [Paenibacillus sp. BC26]